MNLLADMRYSAKSLWRCKGFTVTVIATLALCIGANTTLLSALYGLVLKPLPVKEPERLVQLFNIREGQLVSNNNSQSSWNQYSEYVQRDDLFAGCALRSRTTKLIRRGNAVRRVRGQVTSAGFFELMGAQPLLGRFFRPEEVDPGPGHVVVLSQSAWESEYQGDPEVIGQQLLFDTGVPYTIIGVASRRLEAFDYEARFTIPYPVTDRSRNPARGRYQSFSDDLYLRLQPGVSRAVALEQIRARERHWYETVADADSRESFEQFTRFEFDRGHPLEGSLYLMEGGALLILLLGCFNVVTLVVHRINQKRHELSIRNALGAGKATLYRLVLTESLLLMGAAIGVGLVLAWSGTHVINGYLASLSPSTLPIAIDGKVLAAMLVLTVVVVAVVGLLPVEMLWKSGLLQRLDSSSRTATRSGFSRKLSSGMVVGQIAITVVLLIGAGLLFRSFQKVMAVDPGFDATQVVVGRLDWSTTSPHYPGRSEAGDLKQRIYAAMQEIPGVESVGLSAFKMFSADQRGGETVWHFVSPEFFSTLGIPVRQGRDFNAADDSHALIVDELYARRYFKDRSPIGLAPDPSAAAGQGQSTQRIVGVVGRANLRGLEQRDGTAIVYLCEPVSSAAWEYSIFLRTTRPAAGVIRAMRAKLHEIDPRLPLSYAYSLDEALDEMLIGRKGITLLLLAFAGLALLLSLTGVYAVLAYDVQQRRREIGVRTALGALPGQVLGMVLRQAGRRAGVGLAIGVIGSLYLNRFLQSRLFDITALDPATYLSVIGILLPAVLLAGGLPARRAAKTDPLEALRSE